MKERLKRSATAKAAGAPPAADLQPARRALENALTELHRMELRVAKGEREVLARFGDRTVRMTQVAYKAGSIEDYLASPAYDFARNIEAAVRLIDEGKVESALTVACYMVCSLAGHLERTARGFKDEDREEAARAASKRAKKGRPATVGVFEKAEILRRAAEVREMHPAAASYRNVSKEVLQSFARETGGPFGELASLSEKYVAKILSESWAKKSSAKG